MSERILRALMQLFAIVARVEPTNADEINGLQTVRLFLQERLPQQLVEEYLQLFNSFLETHQKISDSKRGNRKRTALNSVKVLRICTQINGELTQRQKAIVLLRLLEFIHAHKEISAQETEFVTTVAETFNFEASEYELARRFVLRESENAGAANILRINSLPENSNRSLYCAGLNGTIHILRLPSVNLHFVRYEGRDELTISGQVMYPNRIYVLNQGSSIRGQRINPIYYSDIINAFLSDENQEKIIFRAEKVTYKFQNGKVGLHPLSFVENSGNLIGIMGSSGSGKSTLLNILNGNLKPSSGNVLVNGIDVHRESKKIEGVIGYVAQDDLLIEELTVFQNLFFNAQLSFGDKSEAEITDLTNELLSVLGLSDISHLKVGNPLEKTISGGQRKRLNIALELIREPQVLFVDEPTSGLSSRDSENIMDLLKELSLKGKLIFVVIHQPSSDIFKMFSRLLILDNGGYPIYHGNPVDSVIYFKQHVNHINSDESECLHCGNVNPELIFNIIEAQVVDEFGNLTGQRKISPREWNAFYTKVKSESETAPEKVLQVPSSNFSIPNIFQQFGVFFKRDILAKLTNRQYMLINFLEAPVLALLLAFFMRFFIPGSESSSYVFRENENIPAFLFISVIVALFIGLTVSSEEIIRDKRIRKREAFLNLSRGSYLFSKIAIMFGLSAIQMLLFVLIGNTILEIQGMTLSYWLILFSTCCFANMLGLNISSAFNSAKVIYILIPILIIPQLLFSGIIVKFDKLNPIFASQTGVPWIGNVMASRWAYEALAVAQYKRNDYESLFYQYDKRKKFANWKKDYWLSELRNRVANIEQSAGGGGKKLQQDLSLLRNEIDKENNFLQGLNFNSDQLTVEKLNPEIISNLKNYLNQLNEHYKNVFLQADGEREQIISNMTATPEGNEAYLQLYNSQHNDQLEVFVTNRNDLSYIEAYHDQLIQKKDLIYLMPYNSSFFGAHFYAPAKNLFGRYIDTFTANILVIWGMTVLLALCLFGDVFAKVMGFLERSFSFRKAHKK